MLRMKNQQNDSSYSDKTGMFSPPPQSLMLATGTETLGSSPRPQMSCHQHTNLLSDKCLEYNHGNGLSYSSSNLLITNKFKNTHNNRKEKTYNKHRRSNEVDLYRLKLQQNSPEAIQKAFRMKGGQDNAVFCRRLVPFNTEQVNVY